MSLRFRILPAPTEVRDGWATGARSGWAQGPSEERVFELAVELDEVRVGRRPGIEVELPFPSVSSLHARLFRGAGPADWWVEDLGSTNGTWLDGVRLQPGHPRPLRVGQRLRIATVDVVFEGWSAAARGAESTATLARRLISDLFGVVGGAAPTLTVELGPARQPAVGLTDRERRYLAGRADGCDIVLPSEHVSREHAAFVRRWDGVAVSDLASRNGVLVNGIAISGEARLADGDRIDVGRVVLRLADPEDRYLRRLESLGGDVAPAAESSVIPGVAAALAPPSEVATDVARPAESPGIARVQAPTPVVTRAPTPGLGSRAPSALGARGWAARALVAAIVVAAVAGLLVLLLVIR